MSRGISSRWVFLGLVLLGLGAVLAFAYAYFRLIHYTRVTAYHVPPDAWFAARVDLEQAVLFAPVREHLFPVLDDYRRSLQTEGSRLARFEQATDVNLGRDLRELLWVRGVTDEDWAIVVGGLFPSSGLVEGIAEVLEAEGISGCELVESTELHCRTVGLLAKQADDGVLVMATNQRFLEAVSERSDGYQRLGLRPEGAASLGALAPWFLPASRGSALALLPGFGELGKVERLEGYLELGSDTTLTVDLVPTRGQSLAGLANQVEAVRKLLQFRLSVGPGVDWAGEQALIERAELSVTDTGRLRIETIWKRSEIEQAARSAASALERWLSRNAP